VSPFQFEVGIADLTVGVLGLLAFWSDFSFRLAAVMAASIWYGGDAIGHVRQMIVAHNFGPGNAGSWFWTVVLVPIVLVVCMIVVWRQRGGMGKVRLGKIGRVAAIVLTVSISVGGAGDRNASAAEPLPAALQAVLSKPLYKNGVWGLLVVDLDTGEVIHDLAPNRKFMTGSVRKLISVGLALDKLGPNHKFATPIYRRGEITNGVLNGDLILVASGDLSMGGRRNADGTLAVSDFDHNEANSLGNAQLTVPNPPAGYSGLAKQVAQGRIREVKGDVIIDDRLFVPFDFRGEFEVRPIFVNDDVVDVLIGPGAGQRAAVDWRPKSAAFAITSSLAMSASQSALDVKLEPENPACFGAVGCTGEVSGQLPFSFVPPWTKRFPMVRTFRIVEPQNYARTVLIEALRKAGVQVSADAVGTNAATKLPPRDSYAAEAKVAELVSLPYSQYAKWILKVSYNIGADTSLVLLGLTQGADSLPAALAAEKQMLAGQFGIKPDEFAFVDGSGGGESAATPSAVVSFLRRMHEESFFDTYRDCLPILATDGSLGFVTDFLSDPSLAGAKGKVHAKPGTFVVGNGDGTISLRAQALAGYIDAKSWRRLAYALFVNNVSPVKGLGDVVSVFQDEGRISAIIWREY